MKCIKLYICIIIILVFIFNQNQPLINGKDSNSKVMTENSVIYDKEVDKVILYSENHLIFESSNRIYFYYLDECKLQLPYQYIKHELYDNKLYLLTVRNDSFFIIEINLDIYKFYEHLIELEYVGDFIIEKDIIIVGRNKNDGVVLIYSKDYDLIKSVSYGGNGLEQFNKIIYQNNKYYLFGQKDAYSYNGPFLNVGNVGEIKSFICCLDNRLEIIKNYYFNELANIEVFQSIKYYNNYFNIIINANSKYQYRLNMDLELVERFPINDADLIEEIMIPKAQYYHIYINCHNNTLNIYIDDKDHIFNLANLEGQFIKSEYVLGELYIYYNNQNCLNLTKISEYHINKMEPIKINKINSDFKQLNNLQIESYLEDIRCEIYDISPSFSNLISGEYQAIVRCYRENGSFFDLEMPLIVEDYVNIINGGIYQKGLILLFFGSATLNGEPILNGEKITQIGSYELVITNVNNESKVYNFQIVENYPVDHNTQNLKTDYQLQSGEEFNINFNISTNKEVKEVIVNGNSYLNFQQNLNAISLTFTAPNNFGIYQYNIEQIKFADQTLIINQQYLVRVLKLVPIVDLSVKQSPKEVKLALEIRDPDQAVVDFVVDIYHNNNFVAREYSVLNDWDFNIDKSLMNQELEFIVKILYCCDDQNIKEVTLLNWSGKSKKKLKGFFNFEMVNQIDCYQVEITANSQSMETRQLIVNNNLLTNLNNSQNLIMLYISLLCSIPFLGTIIFIIIKLHRKKKYNI